MSNKDRKAIDARIKALLQSRKNLPNYGNINPLSKVSNANNKKIIKTQPRMVVKHVAHVKENVLIPRRVSKFAGSMGTYKHSGDIGDLIYSLPIIKYLGKGDLFLSIQGLQSKKPDGSHSGFTENLLRLLIPLLESQSYINSVEVWNRQPVMVDLDYFRTGSCSILNLCEKMLYSYGVPKTEIQVPWIICQPKKIAKHVFARSFRYRNDLINYEPLLSKCGSDCIFLGLPEEHEDFEKRFGKIKFYKVRDFLEMAEIINGSECFYGNQSSPMALAIAMNKSFVQECFAPHADCVFNRNNARYYR